MHISFHFISCKPLSEIGQNGQMEMKIEMNGTKWRYNTRQLLAVLTQSHEFNFLHLCNVLANACAPRAHNVNRNYIIQFMQKNGHYICERIFDWNGHMAYGFDFSFSIVISVPFRCLIKSNKFAESVNFTNLWTMGRLHEKKNRHKKFLFI